MLQCDIARAFRGILSYSLQRPGLTARPLFCLHDRRPRLYSAEKPPTLNLSPRPLLGLRQGAIGPGSESRMADAETKPTRLQVANLPPGDSGRGVARLPVKLMESLGLVEGAVIEIIGKRSTAARAIRPYGDDAGLDIIRLDGLQRANAGVGSGDFVEIQKAVSKPAGRGVFAPPP